MLIYILIEQRTILSVKPGITDYASIEYFDESRLLGESENPEKLISRNYACKINS
jgi:hypothetical protein